MDVTAVPKIAILDTTGNFMSIDDNTEEEEEKDGDSKVGSGLLELQESTPKMQNEDSWFGRKPGLSRLASNNTSHE